MIGFLSTHSLLLPRQASSNDALPLSRRRLFIFPRQAISAVHRPLHPQNGSMSVATEQSPISKTWHGPPPPAELTTNASSSLQLLSQGAEARVWLVTLPDTATNSGSNSVGGSSGMRSINVGSGISVPQLLSFSQQLSPLSLYRSATNTASSNPMKFICKERFPKKYRHPQLDVSLTKSRTKSEARSLIRCWRADIPCPNVLAIAHWSNKQDAGNGSMNSGKGESNITNTSTTSSCLFLECVEGITVREYLEQQSAAPRNNQTKGADEGSEPKMKRARSEDTDTSTVPDEFQREERITTVIDTQTLCVAHTIGTIVAKMHAAGVVHGDLTTSNIMVRTPPASSGELDTAWKPQLVLIDFGLATSTSSLTNNKTNNASSNKKQSPTKYNTMQKRRRWICMSWNEHFYRRIQSQNCLLRKFGRVIVATLRVWIVTSLSMSLGMLKRVI